MHYGLEVKAAFVDMKLLFRRVVREVTWTIDVCIPKHVSSTQGQGSLLLDSMNAAALVQLQLELEEGHPRLDSFFKRGLPTNWHDLLDGFVEEQIIIHA